MSSNTTRTEPSPPAGRLPSAAVALPTARPVAMALADGLARVLPEVRVTHLDQKGRGRALRSVWSTSDAQVLAHMDIDLSTDLAALLRGALGGTLLRRPVRFQGRPS